MMNYSTTMRGYIVKKPILSTIQFAADEKVMSYYLNSYEKRVIRYLEYHKITTNTTIPVNNSTFITTSVDSDVCRKLLVNFTSDLYLLSPYVSKYEKLNIGLKSLLFSMATLNYPPKNKSMPKMDSLRTTGESNASFFFVENMKTLQVIDQNDFRPIIYEENYCYFCSQNFSYAIKDLVKNRYIEGSESFLNYFSTKSFAECTNKATFSLSFLGQMFDYKGVSCSRECKFEVSYERSNDNIVQLTNVFEIFILEFIKK